MLSRELVLSKQFAYSILCHGHGLISSLFHALNDFCPLETLWCRRMGCGQVSVGIFALLDSPLTVSFCVKQLVSWSKFVD